MKERRMYKTYLNYSFDILTPLCPVCKSEITHAYSISPNECLVRMECASCKKLFVRKIFNLEKTNKRNRNKV